MKRLNSLSQQTLRQIAEDRESGWQNPCRCPDRDALRRNPMHDRGTLWRPDFVRDIEKIMHLPIYNRYTDKTQVFSFYQNDDITRRALHVQLVSRIARNIGVVLGLNLDLIEAIALGHDIGHTPFGHAGERMLSMLLQEKTGRLFNHNVHSVRVLDQLFPQNLSLQTLDGALCHNGEFEQQEYRPRPLGDFEAFDRMTEACYHSREAIDQLIPGTMEGCVVRICDIIAYLGKDRQDAVKAHIISDDSVFTKGNLGVSNSEIINNLVVNIIENSYRKEYIQLDPEIYEEIRIAKQENNAYIYQADKVRKEYEENIQPMLHDVYDRLLQDVRKMDEQSIVYRHHIRNINRYRQQKGQALPYQDYREENPNQIVVDYISSMTDDYFVQLYHHLFPKGSYHIEYISYFG